MKHLAFIFCFIGAGVAFAETWNCGPATDGVYSDSVQCTYDEEAKTLAISGSGEMGDYNVIYMSGNPVSTAPWTGKDIVHVVVDESVTSIGDASFYRAYNLTDITGLENITRVGNIAFERAYNLKSIDLPNVQEIGGVAFKDTHALEYIGIPDGVNYLPDGCSWGISEVCTGYRNLDTFASSKLSNCRKTGECGSCGDKFVQAGVGCVSSCYTGYTSYYGFCTRTRYTLPEADAATSDDFENTIEWIFE